MGVGWNDSDSGSVVATGLSFCLSLTHKRGFAIWEGLDYGLVVVAGRKKASSLQGLAESVRILLRWSPLGSGFGARSGLAHKSVFATGGGPGKVRILVWWSALGYGLGCRSGLEHISVFDVGVGWMKSASCSMVAIGLRIRISF